METDTGFIAATIVTSNPLAALHECGGFYACPKDSDGARKGPLVGYAGTYTAEDGTKKQWVGDIYANFAKTESIPRLTYHFAHHLRDALAPFLEEIDVFCGAPIGGYSFSEMLGLVHDRRVIKAEKKILKLADSLNREHSELVFSRHEPKKGERVAIVEDVCNNFSTTEQLISLIDRSGGTVTAIICLLNRSLIIDTCYESHGRDIPVISLVRIPIREYQQDDPEVVEDVLRGNVVWKPKNEWARLAAAMDSHA